MVFLNDDYYQIRRKGNRFS